MAHQAHPAQPAHQAKADKDVKSSHVDEKGKYTREELLQWVGAADAAVVHYPCPDGESSKILLRDYRSASFPVHHYRHGVTLLEGAFLTQFEGKCVLCIDWCPTLAAIKILAKVAKHVYVIDHHASAHAVEKATSLSNVAFSLGGPTPCASARLWSILYGDKPLPVWLQMVDLHDTGRFAQMTYEDKAHHAALTDDLDAIEVLRHRPREEMVKLGRDLLEKQRPLVAKSCVQRVEYKTLSIHDTKYNVAYVDLPHEKYLQEVNRAFYADKENEKIDILIMRMSLPSNATDFKLRRAPTSTVDLSVIASLYPSGGGHAPAAGIQLPNSPSYLHDIPK